MLCYRSLRIIVIFIFFILRTFLCAQITPLLRAHSHNDYKQSHPLSDALNNGFTSIEADIFLIKGSLIVSHIHPLIRKNRSLEMMYLKPLQDSINNHKGCVYEHFSQPVILLVDIKTDASKTYSALKPLLEKYKSMLTSYSNGKVTNRSVTIILSGNKPYNELQNENNRLAFIDENLLNLIKNKPAELCPLASTKYSNILKWKGKGTIPVDEKQKLITFVTQAHQQNKIVRLWASPENKVVWNELLSCGVDLINTDKLKELKQFLLEQK